MKKLLIVLMCVGLSFPALSQMPGRPGGMKGKDAGNKQEMMARMRSERIAYIISYARLTDAEADKFRTVYERVDAQQQELMRAEHRAFRALKQAIDQGEGDVRTLLDAYVTAKGKNANQHLLASNEYLAILPAEKVAKCYVAEELFRREQINKLRGSHRGPGAEGRMKGREGGER